MTEPQIIDASPAGDLDKNTQSARSAIAHVPSHLRFWTVALLVLWLDLWSKKWVFATIGPHESRPMFGGWFEFRRSLNDGAVFGLFTGQVVLFVVASLVAFVFVFYVFAHSPRTYRALHLALGLILAGALGNLYDRAVMQADVVTRHTGSGAVEKFIGKIVSDPSDDFIRIGDWPEGTNQRRYALSEVEVRKQGVVRDFIKFVPKFPARVPWLGGRDVWQWVFNIADAALVVGVGALLCTSWLGRPAREGF